MPYHPIIRAVLEKCGHTPEEVLQEKAWQRGSSPFMTSAMRMDMPFIMLDSDITTIDWGRSPFEMKIRRTSKGYVFSLTFKSEELPEIMIQSFTGSSLSKLCDIPGAESLIIDEMIFNEDENLYNIMLRQTEEHSSENQEKINAQLREICRLSPADVLL